MIAYRLYSKGAHTRTYILTYLYTDVSVALSPPPLPPRWRREMDFQRTWEKRQTCTLSSDVCHWVWKASLAALAAVHDHVSRIAAAFASGSPVRAELTCVTTVCNAVRCSQISTYGYAFVHQFKDILPSNYGFYTNERCIETEIWKIRQHCQS